VLFPDGSQLYHPSNTAIAEKIGLRTQADRPFYDLAIVGGGPAGLAAAVYGASEGLTTVLLERGAERCRSGTSGRHPSQAVWGRNSHPPGSDGGTATGLLPDLATQGWQ
jgi:glycine/D-amino acid oxidase-like deaminating enzyme